MSRSRVDSPPRLIAALDFEIDTFAVLVFGRLRTDPGYRTVSSLLCRRPSSDDR